MVLTLQRNLKVSGAMGTVRASPKRSEGPKGRRWNRPHGVAGITKQAILRCSTKNNRHFLIRDKNSIQANVKCLCHLE